MDERGNERDNERGFYDERNEAKTHTLLCPHCREEAEYRVTWIVRRKRPEAPRGADAATQARFARARSYMVRLDDVIFCANARCGKKFEIAGLQSVANVQEAATGTPEERAERIRRAFGRRA
jgi:hypothetical protein